MSAMPNPDWSKYEAYFWECVVIHSRSLLGRVPRAVLFVFDDGTAHTINPHGGEAAPPAAAPAMPAWPPANGWGFRTGGEVSYEGVVFTASAKQAAILALLARHPWESVSVERIKKEALKDGRASERTVQNAVSLLRKILVRELAAEADPIEWDAGEEGYRLMLV